MLRKGTAQRPELQPFHIILSIYLFSLYKPLWKNGLVGKTAVYDICVAITGYWILETSIRQIE